MDQFNRTLDYDKSIRSENTLLSSFETATTTATALVSSLLLYHGQNGAAPKGESVVPIYGHFQQVPADASPKYPVINPTTDDSDFVLNVSGAAATAIFYSAIENRTLPNGAVGNGEVVGSIEDLSDDHWDWAELLLACVLCVLIVITVIGNTLVILSVMTTRRLRTVTNCFVMSLAVADWLVGIFVMPPAVAVHLIGSWQLGWILCDIWISFDVLLCTASILSLCAISIDRYLAVTQPLNYSRRRRSKRLALVMILIVWVLALAITCPPILGWYEPGRRDLHECRYNQNEGYVVYSAMGSFFIPTAVMIYVYVRISCVVAARHDHMTEIEVHKKHNKHFDVEVEAELELDPSSEQESQSPYRKRVAASHETTSVNNITTSGVLDHGTICKEKSQNRYGHYELVDTSRPPSIKRPVNTGGISNAATTNNPSGVLKSAVKSTPSSTSSTTTWSKSVHQCSSVKLQPQKTGGIQYEQKPIRTHQKSMSNRISSLKRENKTTQTLSIVVGGFIVCWLPFFVYYLITPFLPHESVSATVTNCLTWLGWFNSAMNPFIYAFYSVDFRAAFWRLTFRRFFKNSLKAPYSSNALSIRR